MKKYIVISMMFLCNLLIASNEAVSANEKVLEVEYIKGCNKNSSNEIAIPYTTIEPLFKELKTKPEAKPEKEKEKVFEICKNK